MYNQLEPETIGFGDCRMIASTTPSTIPSNMARIVSQIVARTPRRMRESNR